MPEHFYNDLVLVCGKYNLMHSTLEQAIDLYESDRRDYAWKMKAIFGEGKSSKPQPKGAVQITVPPEFEEAMRQRTLRLKELKEHE